MSRSCSNCNKIGDKSLFRNKTICRKCYNKNRQKTIVKLYECETCDTECNKSLFRNKTMCNECYNEERREERRNIKKRQHLRMRHCHYCPRILAVSYFKTNKKCKYCHHIHNTYRDRKRNYIKIDLNVNK